MVTVLQKLTKVQVIFLRLHKIGKVKDDHPTMRYFHERLRRHMAELSPPLKYHDLQFLAGIPSGIFSAWKKPVGHKYYRAPSDEDLQKIAAVERLGLTLNRLKGWRAIDLEGPEAVLGAVRDAKEAQGI